MIIKYLASVLYLIQSINNMLVRVLDNNSDDQEVSKTEASLGGGLLGTSPFSEQDIIKYINEKISKQQKEIEKVNNFMWIAVAVVFVSFILLIADILIANIHQTYSQDKSSVNIEFIKK